MSKLIPLKKAKEGKSKILNFVELKALSIFSTFLKTYLPRYNKGTTKDSIQCGVAVNASCYQ